MCDAAGRGGACLKAQPAGQVHRGGSRSRIEGIGDLRQVVLVGGAHYGHRRHRLNGSPAAGILQQLPPPRPQERPPDAARD